MMSWWGLLDIQWGRFERRIPAVRDSGGTPCCPDALTALHNRGKPGRPICETMQEIEPSSCAWLLRSKFMSRWYWIHVKAVTRSDQMLWSNMFLHCQVALHSPLVHWYRKLKAMWPPLVATSHWSHKPTWWQRTHPGHGGMVRPKRSPVDTRDWLLLVLLCFLWDFLDLYGSLRFSFGVWGTSLFQQSDSALEKGILCIRQKLAFGVGQRVFRWARNQ